MKPVRTRAYNQIKRQTNGIVWDQLDVKIFHQVWFYTTGRVFADDVLGLVNNQVFTQIGKKH